MFRILTSGIMILIGLVKWTRQIQMNNGVELPIALVSVTENGTCMTYLSIDTKKSTESSLLLPQGGRIPENELSQDNMSDGGLSYEIGLIEAASNDKLINHRGGDDEDDDEGEDNDQSDGNLSRDNHHLTSKKDLIDSHSLKAQDLVHIDSVADEIATFPIREITDFDPASIAKHSILLLYLVPQQGYLSR